VATYRFEYGGGHWIFGGDPELIRFLESVCPMRMHTRRSAVYLAGSRMTIPYPIQHHLEYLDRDLARSIRQEIRSPRPHSVRTMSDWLSAEFGPTLCRLFFGPFHDRYTAGLWKSIAPQDGFKSPSRARPTDRANTGYNSSFAYPTSGLGALIEGLAASSRVEFNKQVVRVDPLKRRLFFADGSYVKYTYLVSTIPLIRLLELSGLALGVSPDPYTSCLVLNIGAVKGSGCPSEHWIYVPDSVSGFHRVGFYTNVDASFIRDSSIGEELVALYVERAFPGGAKPSDQQIKSYKNAVIAELQDLGFIEEVEVIDESWIETAYTWSWPGSPWRKLALRCLTGHGIYSVGRYGAWRFQGIAASIEEGLAAGRFLRKLAGGSQG
jgi:hypothetical protein